LKSYFKPVLQPFETPPFSLLSPKVSARKEEANQEKKGIRRKQPGLPSDHLLLSPPKHQAQPT
jgi:hypothetical protein